MKLRKVLALGMAAVMTFSLAACGSSDSGSSAGTSGSDTQQAADSTGSADTSTDVGGAVTVQLQRYQVYLPIHRLRLARTIPI